MTSGCGTFSRCLFWMAKAMTTAVLRDFAPHSRLRFTTPLALPERKCQTSSFSQRKSFCRRSSGRHDRHSRSSHGVK